ncbi:MAG: DUF3795 domain-containing protein [Candidatus Kariarchaeaceae archaeon]|jgi:hypothetical protein
MKEIISKCGNICTDCPWSIFARQKVNAEDWETYGQKIKKYVGYMPIKYEWEGCLGCQTPDEDLPNHPHYGFLKKCRTRKCVIHNEITTCAHCTRFPCSNTVTSSGYTKEKISKKLGESVSDEAYKLYIRQFDSMTHLESLHISLDKASLQEPKPHGVGVTIKDFPHGLQSSQYDYLDLFKALRNIVQSNFLLEDTDTMAGYELVQERRQFILRLFWILGLYGDLLDGGKLKIDSISMYENRKPITLPSNEKNWQIYLDVLEDFGIHAQLEVVTDQLYTPGGYMRVKIPQTNEPSYYLSLDLDTNRMSGNFFKNLQKYIGFLNDTSKRGAFSQFCKFDMQKLVGS